jgi:hypothetical protein
MGGAEKLILHRRYGAHRRDPSAEDLAAALEELFVEELPGMREDDYAEHGEAWLRYVRADGSEYVLAVDRRGQVRFEAWADPDYERELSPPLTATAPTVERALGLWLLLAAGDVDGLRRALAPEAG